MGTGLWLNFPKAKKRDLTKISVVAIVSNAEDQDIGLENATTVHRPEIIDEIGLVVVRLQDADEMIIIEETDLEVVHQEILEGVMIMMTEDVVGMIGTDVMIDAVQETILRFGAVVDATHHPQDEIVHRQDATEVLQDVIVLRPDATEVLQGVIVHRQDATEVHLQDVIAHHHQEEKALHPDEIVHPQQNENAHHHHQDGKVLKSLRSQLRWVVHQKEGKLDGNQYIQFAINGASFACLPVLDSLLAA